MEGQLFLVAAVENPTKKDVEDNDALSKVIMEPRLVLARDSEAAAIKVVRSAEELKDINDDYLEVIVRPF